MVVFLKLTELIVVSELVSVGPLCCNAQLSLQLDPMFSPPLSIPTDPARMTYNAPEHDHMLEPVNVRVLSNGVNLMEPVTVIATTILASNLNVPNTGDNYNGTLCQHNKWTHRFGTCRFLDNNCMELNCNTTDPLYPLGKVEVTSVNGVASFERLLHTMYTGGNNRRLRFYAEFNGTTATVDSNIFGVDRESFYPCLCNSIHTCTWYQLFSQKL